MTLLIGGGADICKELANQKPPSVPTPPPDSTTGSQNHKRQETWQLARRTTKLQMQFREAEAVRSTVGGACTCDLGVALALAFGPRGAAMKTTALVSADMGQWMARVWGWTSAFPSKKEVKEG